MRPTTPQPSPEPLSQPKSFRFPEPSSRLASIARTISAVVCCGLAVALSGCALTSTASPKAEPGTAIEGVVHGGQQPIVGAHIYMFAANVTGYGGKGIAPVAGNASISLISNVPGSTYLDSSGGPTNGDYYVTTTAGGNFTITGDYVCVPGQQVYLYVLGGDAGGGPNQNSGLLAILGDCPAAGNFLAALPFIYINEATTIAAAYVMAPFASDAVHVSTSGTPGALLGIQHAFATAFNLVPTSTGVALAITPAGNALVPQAEIYTLADALASCINSSPTFSPANCATLFGATAGAPTDTATAAIDIAQNPALNVSTIFGLVSATSPFQPTLPATYNDFANNYSGLPNDWTIAIVYQDDSIYSTAFIPGIQTYTYLAIDSQSNIWISGYPETVVQLSNNGTMNYDVVETAGTSHYQLSTQNYDQDLAIDLNDNLWVDNNSYGISKVTAAGVLVSPDSWGYSPFGFGFLRAFGGLAIDGGNNVWIGSANNASSQLVETDNNGNGLFYTQPGAGAILNSIFVAIDPAGNVWLANQGYNNSTPDIVSVYDPGAGVFASGAAGYATGGVSSPSAIAFDQAGNAWIANYGNNSISELTPAGVPFAASPFTGGGLSEPSDIAIDGAGNIWVSNWGTVGISEFAPSGTAISPSKGFYRGIYNSGYYTGSIAIDDAGNVWTSNDASISELIGAGAPTINPIAVAITNGTQGTRP